MARILPNTVLYIGKTEGASDGREEGRVVGLERKEGRVNQKGGIQQTGRGGGREGDKR